MRKQDETKLNNYLNATTYELWQIYGNFSVYKARAYENIKQECSRLNGWGVKCFNANCTQYSAGFMYKDGEQTILRYYTKDNTYNIVIA